MTNNLRYVELFSEAIDEMLPPPNVDISGRMDILDVLRVHILLRVVVKLIHYFPGPTLAANPEWD